MKQYAVRITRQARAHLRGIKKYIEEELLEPDVARSTIDSLKEEIKSLSHMPARIKLTDEEPWRSEGVRKIVVKNFLIYFWVDDENMRVQVTAVIYQRRDQLARLADMEWE